MVLKNIQDVYLFVRDEKNQGALVFMAPCSALE
jgi:hypothetical protein